MATVADNVIVKPQMEERENLKVETGTKTGEELKPEKVQEKEPTAEEKVEEPKDDKTPDKESDAEEGTNVTENEEVQEKVSAAEEGKEVTKNEEAKEKDLAKEEDVPVQVEAKTGVSFPVKLSDGKKLSCVGLRKKSMLGMGIKIYSFGIYTDNEKLKDLLKLKIGKAPAKVKKDIYQIAIDGDFGMMVRLVIVFSGLTMNMVKKNFDEGLGASIKKLTGGKNDDQLANKVMGQASDNIKLSPGSVIEISRLPGHTLQTKVMGEVVSKVESELLCRAYVNMYLGDDAFDKEAKEIFGASLLSLF